MSAGDIEKIDLVRGSLARLVPDLDATAGLFYQRLFELAPDARTLFHTDMHEQGRKFMDTLGYMVHGLYRIERIRPVIEELGRNHVRYGASVEHYGVVRDALLWALEEQLGSGFTAEVREAWIYAYDLLAEIMIAAAEADGA